MEFERVRKIISQILSLENETRKRKELDAAVAELDRKASIAEVHRIHDEQAKRFRQVRKITDRVLKNANSRILGGKGKISGWQTRVFDSEVVGRGTFAIGIDAIDYEDTIKHIALCTTLAVPQKGFLVIHTPQQTVYNDNVPRFFEKDSLTVTTKGQGWQPLVADQRVNDKTTISVNDSDKEIQNKLESAISKHLLVLFGAERYDIVV